MGNIYRDKFKPGLIPSPYDKRDYKFSDLVPASAFLIPKEYQTEEFPFVYNQGSTSECAACSYNAIRYLQEHDRKQSEINEPFSPSFTYGNRIDGEIFEGMYLRSVCSKGREGSVLYSEMPGFYDVNTCVAKVNERKEDLLKKAKPFRITSYYKCSHRIEIQAAIMNCKAALIGIYVFPCFYSPNEKGEIIYNPKKDVENDGGHAVVITGWKTDKDGKLWWRVLNSWGKEWGDHGYCWLPEEYPWFDSAYVIVDIVNEYKFARYKKDYYEKGKVISL